VCSPVSFIAWAPDCRAAGRREFGFGIRTRVLLCSAICECSFRNGRQVSSEDVIHRNAGFLAFVLYEDELTPDLILIVCVRRHET